MLTRLDIHNFRNIKALSLQPQPNFNFFYGENGSGKTSILEAIHMLGLGRSFRSRSAQQIITYEQTQLNVFGQLQNSLGSLTPIGIEKHKNGDSRMRVDQKDVISTAILAEILPILVINPASYNLLDAGPKFRRQFLDWGLFHVEQKFMQDWQRLKRALLQRNAALKAKRPPKEVETWDPEFISASLAIEEMRRDYFSQFTPIYNEAFAQISQLEGITLTYKQGWNESRTLEDVLASTFNRDMDLGYTQYGPHRSDLQVTINKVKVQDVLSRGQQKSVVYALRLAQGMLLQKTTGKNCVYLLDDLASELDDRLLRKMTQLLQALQSQVYITGVRLQGIEDFIATTKASVFHVEHGAII